MFSVELIQFGQTGIKEESGAKPYRCIPVWVLFRCNTQYFSKCWEISGFFYSYTVS